MRFSLTILFFIGFAACASAETVLVNPDGSGEYPDFATAMAAVEDEDTILLGDGYFVGDGNRDEE